MPKISDARKDARRSQILQAAIRCFARQGFHRTTIQDICVDAGLSHGAVYSYFDSKDAIIAALASAGRRTGERRIAASRGHAAPADRLRSFLSELERTDGAAVNQFDVRSWAEAIGDAQLRDTYLDSRNDLLAALAEIAAPAAAAKGLAPMALAELIAAIIAGCEVQRAIQPAANLRPLLDALVTLLATPVGVEHP
ncbi:MAG: TetR/AcrR family transcriptional regulator [Caulobacterales bacterium]